MAIALKQIRNADGASILVPGNGRKIDLFRVYRNARGRISKTEYICSTNWSRTCRDAIARFHEINSADAISGKNLVPVNCEIKAQFGESN